MEYIDNLLTTMKEHPIYATVSIVLSGGIFYIGYSKVSHWLGNEIEGTGNIPFPTPKDGEDLIHVDVDDLRQYNGRGKYIYVGIDGKVFDVTEKKDVYGVIGEGYNVFTGGDASRLLGLSSVKEIDAYDDDGVEGGIADFTEDQKKTLNQWLAFFTERYPIVATYDRASERK
mmetsp:Transcript_12731/g.19145  ORF Transcript_12731/g.19145 Transcript_12731/m.19145 type:complete len:172 (+) Transcript_12731:19-534(+)